MLHSSRNRFDGLRVYRMMKLIRRIEERLMEEYHPAEEMRCPMHFCVGQESTPAILSLSLHREDVLMSHYRSHGYYLAKGGALSEMVAEFYGKATGANGGVAGSMELGSHEHNFFSGAIVGGSTIIPLGSSFAQKYRGESAISVAVIGDGSFDEGILYESMNLAALQKLPLLILCENNKYAAHTTIERRLGRAELLPKAEAMGIPGEVIDGYDLDALYDGITGAVTSVRAGRGPRYIEVETYRFCAHVGPRPDDDLEYRTAEEIAAAQAKDPLQRLWENLVRDPGTCAAVADIDAKIEQEVASSIEAAKSAPFHSLEWAIGGTLVNSYAAVVERYQRQQLQPTFAGGQEETRPAPF